MDKSLFLRNTAGFALFCMVEGMCNVCGEKSDNMEFYTVMLKTLWGMLKRSAKEERPRKA